MNKLIQIGTPNLEVDTSTVLIVEFGGLSFEVDERFLWINVYQIDESHPKKEFITEIDEDDMPILVRSEESFNELKKYCLNWYFNNVEIISAGKCTKSEE